MKIIYYNRTIINIPSKILLYNTNATYYKIKFNNKIKYTDKLNIYHQLSNINNIKIKGFQYYQDLYLIDDYIYKYDLEKDNYDENTYHIYKRENIISKSFNIGWFIGNL